MAKRLGVGATIARSVREKLPRPTFKNPFTALTQHVSRGEALRINTLPKTKSTVRVALISLPKLDFGIKEYAITSRSTFSSLTERRACHRQLVRLNNEHAKQLQEDYNNALSYALGKLEADIICVNELGYPTFRQKPRKDVAAKTRRMAREHEAFILAGTYHDPETFYNTGRIFYPGCPTEGAYYHKQVSAVSTQELISIPPNRSTLLSSAHGLWIGVLVCLDLADFSSVAAVVNFQDRCDLLLVPSYTEYTDSLRKLVETTSKAMQGIVALVNYHSPDPALPAFVARQFGEEITMTVHDAPGSAGRVAVIEIDIDEFHESKRQKRFGESPDERMEWLFGNQPHPLVMR